MFRLPKKVFFALEAVVDVAYNARPDPVQSKDITKRQGIPQRYLEQVMQQLVRAGILRGVRGPKGGYRLARERRRISVGDIVRVVGEADEEEKNVDVGKSELGKRVVAPLWDQLETDIMKRLDQITMDDLCNDAAKEGIATAEQESYDFVI